MTASRRCDVCGRHAPGAMPVPELRMTLCVPCDTDLVEWCATGGHVHDWPRLERERRAAVDRGAQAARDKLRDKMAAPVGPPIDADRRRQARIAVAALRDQRGGRA